MQGVNMTGCTWEQALVADESRLWEHPWFQGWMQVSTWMVTPVDRGGDRCRQGWLQGVNMGRFMAENMDGCTLRTEVGSTVDRGLTSGVNMAGLIGDNTDWYRC